MVRKPRYALYELFTLVTCNHANGAKDLDDIDPRKRVDRIVDAFVPYYARNLTVGSSGYIDHLARDERRFVTGEEGHDCRDVFGLANSSDGDLFSRESFEVLEFHADSFCGVSRHVGFDETRCDRVDGNPVLAQFDCQGLREALKSSLRCRVVCLSTVS